MQKAVAIGQHDAVKLAPLFFVHLARLQSFEIKTDGGDGSFKLVRDGVDKSIVLFVTTYLTHQKSRIQHQAADDRDEKDDAEDEQRDFAPVEQNPTDVERHGQQHQTRA